MPEVMELAEAPKARRAARKADDVELLEPGPTEGHNIQVPRNVWKAAHKLAIDLDMSASAFVVQAVCSRLRRFGLRYKGLDPLEKVSANQEAEVNNSVEGLPVSEEAPAGGESSGSEGEGTTEPAPPERRRRRP